jgi:hypothetical protein
MAWPSDAATTATGAAGTGIDEARMLELMTVDEPQHIGV